MSVAGLLILLVMSAVLVSVIVWPFVRPAPDTKQHVLDKQRERALAYYERVLTNVRDLDEDYATGKISLEEYTPERELWADRGVKILRLLDDLDQQHPLVDADHADDAAVDAAIEEAVRAVRLTTQEGIA